MAHIDRSPTSAGGYTPPKDRPTPRRNSRAVADARRTAWRSRLEWIAIALAIGVLIALLFLLGWDGSGATVRPVGGHG